MTAATTTADTLTRKTNRAQTYDAHAHDAREEAAILRDLGQYTQAEQAESVARMYDEWATDLWRELDDAECEAVS